MRKARVSHNRGGPENPLSDEELRTKFRSNAERALPGDRVRELEEKLLLALAGLEDPGDLMAMCQAR